MIDWMRRCDINRMTPAEKAILDALIAVEALPADRRLSDAVLLLSHARYCVSDYVDGVPRRPFSFNMFQEEPTSNATAYRDLRARLRAAVTGNIDTDVLIAIATELAP